MINGTFVSNFERILDLKNRFDEEKRYLSNNLVRGFESLHARYITAFNTNLTNIDVRETDGNHKFSNVFVFEILYENSYLPAFPVRINNINYQTDSDGRIQYTANYERPIVMTVGHHLYKHFRTRELAIYFNDTFSPLFNRNITIRIDNSSDAARNVFARIFESRGYKNGNEERYHYRNKTF